MGKKIADGNSLLPQWFTNAAFYTFCGAIALLAVIAGGIVWLLAFAIDIRGHWQRFRDWQRERAITRSLK